MGTVVANVISALAIATLGLGARWLGLRCWPSAARVDADELYATLAVIEHLGGQSRALGGGLRTPWTFRDTEVSERDLQLRLDTAKARIGDADLSERLDAIGKQVRGLWATAWLDRDPVGPLNEETGQYPPDPSAPVLAARQREAAQALELSVPLARARLRTLENRARLQFAR
jgi:hypothetical protein